MLNKIYTISFFDRCNGTERTRVCLQSKLELQNQIRLQVSNLKHEQLSFFSNHIYLPILSVQDYKNIYDRVNCS